MNEAGTRVYHCHKCGRILAVGRIDGGALTIQCRSCKEKTTIAAPERKVAA